MADWLDRSLATLRDPPAAMLITFGVLYLIAWFVDLWWRARR